MSNKMMPRKCTICGNEYAPVNPNQKACNNEACRRENMLRTARAVSARKRAAKVHEWKVVKRCCVCGDEFMPHRFNQRSCSKDECKAAIRKGNGISLGPRTCACCGDEFMPLMVTQIICGKHECYRWRKNRQRKGDTITDSMDCPWEKSLFDTAPSLGVSWYGIDADPMTLGAWGCDATTTFKAPVAQECAA